MTKYIDREIAIAAMRPELRTLFTRGQAVDALRALPGVDAPPEVQALVEALKVCEAELNQYVWQEYPLDHPTHERYRQRDFAANPATLALAAWEAKQ